MVEFVYFIDFLGTEIFLVQGLQQRESRQN